MVTLFQDYFEKRYSARLFSCSTLVVGILFLATVILPYIIVYITHGKLDYHKQFLEGMWVKESFYFE